MTGSPDPPGAAVALQIKAKGIRDPRTLKAIAKFDRRRFLPPDERHRSQADEAVPIGLGQTISQPYMVGLMTAALELTGTEKVLEVGTGSGYQTAILSAMAGQVYTIERLPTLSLRARGILDGLGVENVHYSVGDGSLGWPESAPFDRILVAAGSPSLPPALFGQLAEGGLLLAPIGEEAGQRLTAVRKVGGRPEVKELIACRFVKLIGAGGWDIDADWTI